MNKLNYCELPSISCSMRTGNSKSYFPNQSEYCTMFNRDQVSKFINKNKQLQKYDVCYQNDEKKAGDFICHLNDNGRCVGYAVDCKDLEKKETVKNNDYKEVNKDVMCMPSRLMKNCKNNVPDTNAKLYINGKAFYQCQKDDPMCISDVYSANRKGLPVSQNYSDPVNRKVLYTKTYESPISDKRIISCPDGYNVCDNMCCWKDKKCVPTESSMLGSPYPFCEYGEDIKNLYVDNYPKVGQFETEKECLNWCANNPDCKTVVRYLDRSGNLQCKYYKYDTKDNRIKLVDDKTSKVFNKRKYPYVPNP